MSHKASCLGYAVAVLVGLVSLLTPRLSPAHPLGNFSISHYTSLRLEPEAVELHYIVDMAEIPTFQEIQESGIVPQAGSPGLHDYLVQKSEILRGGLQLDVNGRRLALQSIAREVIFPPGAGGLPTLKLGLVYRAPLDATTPEEPYRLHYRDRNFPGRAGWQEIIAVAAPGVELVQSSVPATDRSQALTNYPTDLLNSPPQVLEALVLFRQEAPQTLAGGNAPGPRNSAAATLALAQLPQGERASLALAANQQATPRSAFTALVTTPQLSLGVMLLSLAVAAALGALHALEPGHGKAVVAAYLVGTRGTARHALSLGLVVTATHTAGVYLLGAVTLYASRYVVPERLYPWLGVLSGLTIAGLGGYLLLRRYAAGRQEHTPAHSHGHSHHTHAHAQAPAYGHTHDHDHHHEITQHRHAPSHTPPHADAYLTHAYDHEGYHHHHPIPGETVSCRELLTLGITGGMVPCPAALVVLLSAVALQRIGFGLLLIVAFSVGLAAVLMAIGLLMVYARQFMARFQGEGLLLRRWLPLASAAVVTVFGMAITMQALVTSGVLHIRL